MAGSITQRKFGGTNPGASIGITLDSSVTAGKKLLAVMGCYSTNRNGTLTASGGGTWTPQESNQSGTTRMAIAICESATGGATTVTVSSSGTGDQYVSAVILELDGLASTCYDVDASSAANNTAFTTGTTASPAQANNMVFAWFTAESTNTQKTPTGFTNLELLNDASTGQPYSLSWKAITSSAAQNAAYTSDTSASWAAAIFVLKEGSGAPAANILRQMMAHHGG